MLTPCFVSTFYMAPRLFNYSQFVKDAGRASPWEYPPLLDFIDLLIVDEAGQVSPEVGAATFALAKRAVVVGDILQIEPVWNVPKKVDYANLKRYGLIKGINDHAAIEDLHSKGFLSSSGSIMKLAQKASPYHLHPEADRGMLLTEHRRCFDEIIGYCNKLAYGGLLEPKKGKAKDNLLAPMQFIETSGTSTVRGSSRSNPDEANTIAEWLLANQQQILQHYQAKENIEAAKQARTPKKIKLGDVVAIITPFTGQKATLKYTLRNRPGIDVSGLIIGTVHALQGAEREIVLFSGTYGTNDTDKGFFFDGGVNMLNVAVSRAKEAFIVFGTKAVFHRKAETPSAMLYRYIAEGNSV
jgi:superfamily I DNA and/or RNA helicase